MDLQRGDTAVARQRFSKRFAQLHKLGVLKSHPND